MPVWNTYAYILDGTIRDLISYKFDENFQANYCARALLGENAIAVDVTYLPVNPDTDFYDYDTQSFYRFDENNNRIYLQPSLNPIETVNLLQTTVENLMKDFRYKVSSALFEAGIIGTQASKDLLLQINNANASNFNMSNINI